MNWVNWLGNPVRVSTGVTVLDLPDGEIDHICRGEKLGDPAILRFRDPGCFRAGEILPKLPYLGRFSTVAQSKIRRLVNRYCNDLDIKLVFTTFKLRNIFSVKDSVPRELRSRVIYKFTCACCNACYIGETGRHFSTRVREHLSSDKSSHIFKHLQSSERCRQSCSADCFEILDSAPTKFQLKLKEAMHINWEKPNLNQQVHHVNLTLTL